jgi:hypothetical protein
VGFVGIYIGSFVHVLLGVALVLFVVGLLSGRRSLVWWREVERHATNLEPSHVEQDRA